jgi:hypothetical protein
VPDAGWMSAAGARKVVEAAGRFVASLSPQDKVALLTIPVGPAVDFTTDHARIAGVLENVRGSRRRWRPPAGVPLNDGTEAARVTRRCSCPRSAEARAQESAEARRFFALDRVLARARGRALVGAFARRDGASSARRAFTSLRTSAAGSGSLGGKRIVPGLVS